MPRLGPASVGAAAHVFVADLVAPALAHHDDHHLRRVLRIRDGQQITIADGHGSWRPARLVPGGVEPTGGVEVVARPSPAITVAFAPVKGDRPEWTVQKLTELGVDRIIPLRAARSVVRWDDERGRAQVERFGRVAREAAMQSRQAWLPEVGPITELTSLVRDHGPVALAEPGGDPVSLAVPVVAIGPEGGWAQDELAGAAAVVDLGPTILRAETAAVVAASLLTALRTGTLVRGPTQSD